MKISAAITMGTTRNPRPIVAADDVAENIQIEHHCQKSHQCKDDKELHGLCIHLLVVLIAALAEYKRLVGVAESLCQHCHHHGNLAGGSIDAGSCTVASAWSG